MTADRRLVSIRRRVPADRRAAYRAAWRRLAATVEAEGAHAWSFRAASGEPIYIEFLEFRAYADPRGDADVEASMRALDGVAEPERTEEWVEAGEP